MCGRDQLFINWLTGIFPVNTPRSQSQKSGYTICFLFFYYIHFNTIYNKPCIWWYHKTCSLSRKICNIHGTTSRAWPYIKWNKTHEHLIYIHIGTYTHCQSLPRFIYSSLSQILCTLTIMRNYNKTKYIHI